MTVMGMGAATMCCASWLEPEQLPGAPVIGWPDTAVKNLSYSCRKPTRRVLACRLSVSGSGWRI